MAAGDFPIGRLRWVLTLVRRDQSMDEYGAGMIERMDVIATVRADIQPVGPLTFWGSAGGTMQTDGPVTHKITLRWLDNLDQSLAFLRQTNRPDGTVSTETFRVRRVMDLDGRKRFSLVEVELERKPS